MATTPRNTMRELRVEIHQPLASMARNIQLELIKTTPKASGAASRAWTNPEKISRDDFNSVITTNSRPYVPRLNEGWSKQAPPGYIEASIEKIVRRYNR